MNGEILKGKNARGPTAIRSKLEWLLSDPMDGTVSNLTVHENLTNAPPIELKPRNCNEIKLITTLKTFWDTETIRINEIPNEDKANPSWQM